MYKVNVLLLHVLYIHNLYDRYFIHPIKNVLKKDVQDDNDIIFFIWITNLVI